MKALILVLALLSTAAFAGTTWKETGGLAVFHADGQNAVNIKATADKTALEVCKELAHTTVGHSTCTDVYTIDTLGSCSDVPKPKWVVELDANGYLVKPAFRSKFKEGSDTEFVHEVEDFVPGPGYPNCWIPGYRIAMQEDFSDDSADLLVQEPVIWSEELQALWVASCPNRHVPGQDIRYPEDTCP